MLKILETKISIINFSGERKKALFIFIVKTELALFIYIHIYNYICSKQVSIKKRDSLNYLKINGIN